MPPFCERHQVYYSRVNGTMQCAQCHSEAMTPTPPVPEMTKTKDFTRIGQASEATDGAATAFTDEKG